jgi:hypothetical protein
MRNGKEKAYCLYMRKTSSSLRRIYFIFFLILFQKGYMLILITVSGATLNIPKCDIAVSKGL